VIPPVREGTVGGIRLPARIRSPLPLLAVAALVSLPGQAPAQESLERSFNLDGGWTGQTGMLYVNAPFRFTPDGAAETELGARFGVELGLGLPRDLLVGLRFAPESPVIAGRPTEWEPVGRYAPLGQARGHVLDAATTWGWNGAARSLDGEVSLGRWLGPLRLLAALRTMTNAYGADDSRVAVAGGAVWHPRPGGLPVALAGDIAALTDRQPGEEAAWSAAVQVGLSFTAHTASVFAANTASPTIQGSSRGDGTVRYGFGLGIPIPVGRYLGWVLPREEAAESVVAPAPEEGVARRAEMSRYLFLPKRIEIRAGSAVEWVNVDDVLHTVNAEDGSWNSGPVQPGESWRARFDRPGRYLYYCGPHPFMKGEVIVR
jgi:plastocyanin